MNRCDATARVASGSALPRCRWTNVDGAGRGRHPGVRARLTLSRSIVQRLAAEAGIDDEVDAGPSRRSQPASAAVNARTATANCQRREDEMERFFMVAPVDERA